MMVQIKKIRMNKKIIAGTAAIAILSFMALAVMLFHTDKKRKIQDEIAIYMTYCNEDNDYMAYRTDSDEYNKPKVIMSEGKPEGALCIINGKDQPINMTLIVEKDLSVVYEEKIKFDEDKCIIDLSCYGEGIYDISFVLDNNEERSYYVSTAYSFVNSVTEEGITDKALYMINDISLAMEEDEAFIFNYPFVWETCGKSFSAQCQLKFDSKETGAMKIVNHSSKDIQSAGIVCSTPLWTYEISELFGEFTEEKFFYINADSINGRKVDKSIVYVDSGEKLGKLISDGKPQLLDETDNIVFAGELTLDSLYIDKHISIEFAGNVMITGSIVFSVMDEGRISIDTAQNSTALTDKIYFETPQTDVVWNGHDAVTYDYVQSYMNVKSYNGTNTDPYIGGTGNTKLVSGTISEKNSQEIELSVNGNNITVKMGYTNKVDFNQAILNVSLDGEGTGQIEEHEGTYYCVITDENKNTRGYKMNISYKEYSLPVVYITTDSGTKISSKEEYIKGKFSIEYNGNGQYEDIIQEEMNIRGRGNSSWELQKKPYKIKFESKTSLFGLTAAKEWVLQANHIDRSLIRNTLAMNMASLLDNMLFTPHSYLVDVFVNGEYQGVYSLTEQIEVKKGRIEGEKDSGEVDTDYLIELGGDEEATDFGTNVFASYLYGWIEIKNPDSDVLSYEQYLYIMQYMETVDDAVMNLDNYEEYLDIPSLIDWFILNEFSYNVDGTFRRSDFMLKKKGGKLYIAAPWDFDYAFGNFSLDSSKYAEWICLGNSLTDAYKGKYIKTNWMTYLLTDENFCRQLKTRWEEVGKALYDKAMETIDYAELNVYMSAEENFIKWNKCLGVKLQYESKKTLALTTYEEHLEYLRNFIKNRYEWMDKTINDL